MFRTAVAVALLVILAGCAGVAPPAADTAGEGTADGTPPVDSGGTVDSPADFADPLTDRRGLEGGYWYDEPIPLAPDDGLNATERAALVNRTMARVERIRGLEFRRPVPVSTVSREAFAERSRNRSVSRAHRSLDNAKFEALLMIGEGTDSVAIQNDNAASSVGGYYTPGRDRIVIVGDGDGAFLLDERTLAHELVHALQDQQFDLGRYDRRTHDGRTALDGLIEGDARFVAHRYGERCGEDWRCTAPPAAGVGAGSGDGGDLTNYGPYLLTYHPYSDGPTFVRSLYREGGWSAVDDAYRDPPVSTEQVIHPERYPDDTPRRPRVRDRTRGSWERLSAPGRPDHDALGEAALNAMLVYPGYESGGETQVAPLEGFLNRDGGGVDRFDPLEYDHPFSDGIRGDRLVVYRNADGETGYVWRLTFDDGAQAREFLEGYRQLLQYRGAVERDADAPGSVYRIPEDDPDGFADAFRVVRDGDTVTVTNAPTVRDLDRVRAPP